MKPHPRIRKTVKWGGLALTVLLLVVWIGSGWVTFQASRARGQDGYQLGVSSGLIGLERFHTLGSYLETATYKFSRETNHYRWWAGHFEQENVSNTRDAWFFPIWWLVLPVGAATGIAWGLEAARRRRLRLNLCPACRYSRTGLPPGGACPECGSPAPAVNP